MSSLPPNFTYPFDPTGLAASNKITNEQHVITAVNYKDYHFIVPRWAPFFADGLRLRFVDINNNSRELVEGIDYYLGFRFATASRACAKPIFGGISFLDNTLNGVIVIDQYQTLGGRWNIDTAAISVLLADRLHNPRLTSWESVIDQPIYFPPINHDWRIEDMVGMSDVVQSLAGIEMAIRDANSDGLSTHAMNYENPHRTTAAQVGAYSKAEIDAMLSGIASGGAALNTIRFDNKNAQEYKDWVLEGTAYNAQRLGNLTYEALFTNVRSNIPVANITGAYSANQLDAFLANKLDVTGRARDSERLNGMLYNELFNNIRMNIPVENVTGALSQEMLDGVVASKLDATGTAADTYKFDGKLPAEFKNWVLDGKTSDTELLTGKTFDEVRDEITEHANDIIFEHLTDNPKLSKFIYPAKREANPDNEPHRWTLLASFDEPSSTFIKDEGVCIFSVAGEDLPGGVYYLTCSHHYDLEEEKTVYTYLVKRLYSGVTESVKFGVTRETVAGVDEQNNAMTFERTHFWLQTPFDTHAITVAEVTEGNGFLPKEPVQETEEPDTIEYLDVEDLVYPNQAQQIRYPAHYADISAEHVWTKIARINVPNWNATNIGDTQLLVTGGDSIFGMDGSSSYLVRINARDPIAVFNCEVTRLNGSTQEAVFGLTVLETQNEDESIDYQAELWLKTASSPSEISVTELAQATCELFEEATHVYVEPTSIRYYPHRDFLDLYTFNTYREEVEEEYATKNELSMLENTVGATYVPNTLFQSNNDYIHGTFVTSSAFWEQMGFVAGNYTTLELFNSEIQRINSSFLPVDAATSHFALKQDIAEAIDGIRDIFIAATGIITATTP